MEDRFEPTRWKRLLMQDGSLWMETSNGAEIERELVVSADMNLTEQRLYEKIEREWRDV